MNQLTIFKIKKSKPSIIVEWFYYKRGILKNFGVEPIGDWFNDLYPEKEAFKDFASLEESEHYNMLIRNQQNHEYLKSNSEPPSLILKPNHESDS